MTYEEWEASVHERIQREPIGQFLGYRRSLFLYDLAWRDCEGWIQDARGRALAEQLIRSAGSIGANEEGHGRGYGKQRNCFFAVAIGSARESEGWYWRAQHLFTREVLDHRRSLTDAGMHPRGHRSAGHRAQPPAFSLIR